ncbi:hypothetical protein P692DRAFT_201152191 [Suillus brevipes Sb2]|nr:hypothetical protein P692DRAFT_201152191 [Suillus brevipes Sb2]
MITITSSAQCICALYIGIFVHRFDMMAWPNDSSVWGDVSKWFLFHRRNRRNGYALASSSMAKEYAHSCFIRISLRTSMTA